MPTLTIQNGARAGRRIEVTEPLTLGRYNVDIPIDAADASRRHAVIRPLGDGELEVADLGSTNGTWVNGELIGAPTRLSPGDVIGLGSILVVVDADADAVRTPKGTRSRLVWRAVSGQNAVVHAPEGSYADRIADRELAHADAAVVGLAQILEAADTSLPEEHVTIYITDAVTGGETDDAGQPPDGDGIVRTVAPESPGDHVAYALVPLLLRRWFGPGPSRDPLIVSGLAGLLAARDAPTPEDADEIVGARLAEGADVTIAACTDPVPDPVATSFMAFLLSIEGPGAVSATLRAYDPERRDSAFVSVYQQPLGALEEQWLARLRASGNPPQTLRALVRHLVPLMRPHRLRWIEIFVYLVIGVAYAIVIPLAFKYLVDTIIPRGSVSRLGAFAGILLVIFTANALVTLRRSYLTAWLNQRVLFDLQARMVERLMQLSHDFYARARVGDLIARLSGDLNAVQQATAGVLVDGTFQAMSALAAAVTALVLSPLLGVLVLVVVPLFMLSYRLLLSRIRALGREVQARYGRLAASLQEQLSAHELIKAFGLERRAHSSYRGNVEGLFRPLVRVTLLSSLFTASVGMAVTLGELVIMAAGGYLVIKHRLSLGTLVAFVGLLPTFFDPITRLSTAGEEVHRAAGSMERMLEILDAPVAIAGGQHELPRLSGAIVLEDVSFGYSRHQPVLRGLTMEIPAGSHVAIVGRSGSGKSTIINLLLRFWDPDEGRVAFGGIDIREATLGSLRGQIGLVSQETFVFDTTVRENIALGSERATDAAVLKAARAAQLQGWIESLPAGIDTVVGERGARMSGGQRQRLAIARALVRDPAVLVLDEATSALDAGTEAEIIETLVQAAAGRTVFSVTHRLSLAARSDYIFVLDEGRVAEQGTHRELVGAGGLYQRLYDEQTSASRQSNVPEATLLAALHRVPLLSNLQERELAQISSRLASERCGAGEQIVGQGDISQKLYLVSGGELEVVVADRSGERRVNSLRPGDYFGEMALIADEPQQGAVRAVVASELRTLDRADLDALLGHDGGAQLAIAAQIAERRRARAGASRAMSTIDVALT